MKYPNLVVLSFANQSSALVAVGDLPVDAEVLELGQPHAGSVTLLVATQKNFLLASQLDAIDCLYLAAPKLELLQGYFKQKNTQVKNNLLVLESPKLSSIFSAVDALLKHTSYELIEISRATGSLPRSVAYLANGSCVDEPAQTPDLSVQLFEAPSKQMLQLFNVQ